MPIPANYRHSQEQPSNEQLRDAMAKALATGQMAELRSLRAQRTTWFDTPELDLMAALDATLGYSSTVCLRPGARELLASLAPTPPVQA